MAADFTCNCVLDDRVTENFYQALDRYADERANQTPARSYNYCLNRAAKDVAFRAAQFTHHAAIGDLRSMLGQAARKGKARATGAAGAILAARMARAGKSARKVPAAAFQELVRKFVGRTLSSVNFMRSGWLPAAKQLQSLVRESSGVSVSAAFGRTTEDERGEFAKHVYGSIGGVIPARAVGSDTLAVEIWNDSVNPRNATSWGKGLGKYGVQGLEAALADKAADLDNYVEAAMAARGEEFLAK